MVTVTVRLSAETRLRLWSVVTVIIVLAVETAALYGPNVCMVKQKYNITKRVKYRAPMSVRTYEWCMSIPPRCSKWSTEMRDLTRLETEERTAEVAVCCPGYKMKDVSCVPICPHGKTGHGCSQDCPPNKWGPNCVHECGPCEHGSCSPLTGDCSCLHGWAGESCESRMSSTTSSSTSTTARVEELLTKQPATKTTPPTFTTPTTPSATTAFVASTTTRKTTSPAEIISTEKSVPYESTSLQTDIHENLTTFSPTVVDNIPSPKNELKVEKTITKSDIRTTEGSIRPTTVLSTLPTTSTTKETTTMKIQVTTEAMTVTTTAITKPSTLENTITKQTSTEKTTSMTNKNKNDSVAVITATTELYNQTELYNNMTLPTFTTEAFRPITHQTQIPSYNKTEISHETSSYPKEVYVEIKTTPVKIIKTNDAAKFHKTTAINVFTRAPLEASHATTETTPKLETTRRPDATIRYFPTTVKFKPKEIWIRPAQKGQEAFLEAKKNHDLHMRHRVATNKESSPITTPKTIIVSIIPTSVSYSSFKRIALSTAPVLLQPTNMTLRPQNSSTGQGFTRPMSVATTVAPLSSTTSTPSTSRAAHDAKPTTSRVIKVSKSYDHLHRAATSLTTLPIARTASKPQTKPLSGTNSMATVTQNLNSSNSVTPTISSTNHAKTTHKPSAVSRNKDTPRLDNVTRPVVKIITPAPINVTVTENDTAKPEIVLQKTNSTKIRDTANKATTESADDEETFHILTEPEHITAVMDDKGKGRTSVDLISVISIAGGIMMAVITVAVVIVMVERCRRPRFDDGRKMNDIHMQVMIDNNDVPPPYVRSIFHTPLPDPPTSEKCHYQPISTLDRNLKQFMRPVVVQTISPIMLENFREILECHYDHLPRRSADYHEMKSKHISTAPSSGDLDELARLRPCSIAESTIDALTCEAQLDDIIDSTTSEPLYAEIPCWRPPSEHAIEVINYNGEAITEL